MKTISRVIPLLALALLPLVPATRAADPAVPVEQARPRMKRVRENRLKQLDAKLHLSAEQKTRIEAIWAQAAAQGRALGKEQADAAANRRTRRREVMRAAHEQVRTVLTPEQQKLFDEMPPNASRSAPESDGEGR